MRFLSTRRRVPGDDLLFEHSFRRRSANVATTPCIIMRWFGRFTGVTCNMQYKNDIGTELDTFCCVYDLSDGPSGHPSPNLPKNNMYYYKMLFNLYVSHRKARLLTAFVLVGVPGFVAAAAFAATAAPPLPPGPLWQQSQANIRHVRTKSSPTKKVIRLEQRNAYQLRFSRHSCSADKVVVATVALSLIVVVVIKMWFYGIEVIQMWLFIIRTFVLVHSRVGCRIRLALPFSFLKWVSNQMSN